MKKTNFKTVVFLEDYATKKAGDEFSCDGQLATMLIEKKVAKYKPENTTVPNKDEEPKAPKSAKKK